MGNGRDLKCAIADQATRQYLGTGHRRRMDRDEVNVGGQ